MHFPALAGAIDPDELASLVPAPWDRVLPALVDTLADRTDADVATLADTLGGEAAAELRAVAVEALPVESPEAAGSGMSDTLQRLRQRRLAEQERELTRRLRQATTEAEQQTILEEKQRIQELKRRTLDPHPVRAVRA